MTWLFILIGFLAGWILGRLHQCRLDNQIKPLRRMTDYEQVIEWPERTWLKDRRRELRIINGGKR